MGASIGAILSPSWHSMCTGARQLGLEEGSDVDGMVAGLYTAATHGGLFFGPTIGSPVMQAYGFEWSATLTAAICFCSVSAVITYVIIKRMCLKRNIKKNINDVKTEASQLVEMHEVYDYKSDATHIQQNDQQKENATHHH
ncbi:hypothetical protein V1264_009405 [Littorina saxatilis]|uniref:Uncharacterized protein n=2 Tax=Littorina saxatilis TaxID=31220 RepID=A0AAN9ARC8_9CAEN